MSEDTVPANPAAVVAIVPGAPSVPLRLPLAGVG
jgi:hypothetical protein